VPRLLDLGVEGYLLRSTLRAVIAQRLVRQLCDHCKIAKPLDEETCRNDPRFGHLGLAAGDVTWHPVGCERCGQSGYRGRVGVFEMLELTSSLRELIADSADGLAIDRLAMREGMTTMLDDGVAKCRAGVTSTSELFRVLVAR
ncbi:MAG: type II/IV secretion system protein, partial [Bradyrhizobium sp.]|nr:type II/IV secretion system protein [Bradyrhizobium sp.]